MEKTYSFDTNPADRNAAVLYITEKDENGYAEILLRKGKHEISIYLEDSDIRDVLQALVEIL